MITAVGLVGIVILLIGWYVVVPFIERREERKQELEEERAKEEARLATKRRELKRLEAEARGEESFLSAKYRERYAHEHYEEVRGEAWKKKLDEYARWEADPDFEQLLPELGSDGKQMLEVWQAKRAVKAFADGLTIHHRDSWDAQMRKKFMEAADRGVTIAELDREEYQKEEIARRRSTFVRRVYYCYMQNTRRKQEEERRSPISTSFQECFEHSQWMKTLDEVGNNPERPAEALSALEELEEDKAGLAYGEFLDELILALLQSRDGRRDPKVLLRAEPTFLSSLSRYFPTADQFASVLADHENDRLKRVDKCVEKELQAYKDSPGPSLEVDDAYWRDLVRKRLWEQRSASYFKPYWVGRRP